MENNLKTEVEYTFKIGEKEYSMVDSVIKDNLDKAIKRMDDIVKNTSDVLIKDSKEYKDTQEAWMELDDALENNKFNLYLSKQEADYIVKCLKTKTEYSVNTANVGIDIIDRIDNIDFEKENPFGCLVVTAAEVTFIYHAINTQKFKGINRDMYSAHDIILKIGAISKIINYYDNKLKTFTDNKKILIEKIIKEADLTQDYNGLTYTLIDKDIYDNIINDIKVLDDYMNAHNGRGKSEDEKNTYYKESKELWNKITEDAKNIKFNLYQSKSDYNFLMNELIGKTEFDIDTLFTALPINELLTDARSIYKNNDIEQMPIKMSSDDITNLYYTIKGITNKGINTYTERLNTLILKIGKISNIINYIDKRLGKISNDMGQWLALFDENVSADNISDVSKKDNITVDVK